MYPYWELQGHFEFSKTPQGTTWRHIPTSSEKSSTQKYKLGRGYVIVLWRVFMFYMHPYLQTLKFMRFSIDADQRGSTTFRCSKNWGKPDFGKLRWRGCSKNVRIPGVSSHSNPSGFWLRQVPFHSSSRFSSFLRILGQGMTHVLKFKSSCRGFLGRQPFSMWMILDLGHLFLKAS